MFSKHSDITLSKVHLSLQFEKQTQGTQALLLTLDIAF